MPDDDYLNDDTYYNGPGGFGFAPESALVSNDISQPYETLWDEPSLKRVRYEDADEDMDMGHPLYLPGPRVIDPPTNSGSGIFNRPGQLTSFERAAWLLDDDHNFDAPMAKYKRRKSSTSRRSRYKRRYTTYGFAGRLLSRAYRQAKAQARWDSVKHLFNTEYALKADPLLTIGGAAQNAILRGRGAYGLGKLGRSIGGRVGKAFGSRRAGKAIGGFLGRNALSMAGLGGYVAHGMGAYDDGIDNSSGSAVAIS